MYAELGPLVRPAVMPPNYGGSVQYNALIHDQNIGKDPAGTVWSTTQIPAQVHIT